MSARAMYRAMMRLTYILVQGRGRFRLGRRVLESNYKITARAAAGTVVLSGARMFWLGRWSSGRHLAEIMRVSKLLRVLRHVWAVLGGGGVVVASGGWERPGWGGWRGGGRRSARRTVSVAFCGADHVDSWKVGQGSTALRGAGSRSAGLVAPSPT